MKKQLLKYCYENENKFVSELIELGEDGQEQFDCLVTLVEDENIKTFEELKKYGMSY